MDKCPRCGADYRGISYTTVGTPIGLRQWECGTDEHVSGELMCGVECYERQLTAHKQLLTDQCEHESEARKIAAPVIGAIAAYGDGYGVPTIADVVESIVAKHATLRAKYERAIKLIRDNEFVQVDGRLIFDPYMNHEVLWPECPDCFSIERQGHAPDCKRAAILAESQETP